MALMNLTCNRRSDGQLFGPLLRTLAQAGVLAVAVVAAVLAVGEEAVIDDSAPLTLPLPGAHQLRILTPTLLELTLITTKEPAPARVRQWDFVTNQSKLNLPPTTDFSVKSGSRKSVVQKVGFKRRVLYAPLRQRDLRIANELYLELAEPVRATGAGQRTGRSQQSERPFVAGGDALQRQNGSVALEPRAAHQPAWLSAERAQEGDARLLSRQSW
jgi:hypothetical protein